jgi:hypothetical protein
MCKMHCDDGGDGIECSYCDHCGVHSPNDECNGSLCTVLDKVIACHEVLD